MEDLNAKIISLAKLGLTGTAREFIPGLRTFPYRNRCIYFVVTDSEMTVLRVLHGHQDISPDHFTDIKD